MDKEKKHDKRYFQVLIRVMDIFKQEKVKSLRELRGLTESNGHHHTTLEAVLQELLASGYIRQDNQVKLDPQGEPEKRPYKIRYYYNQALDEPPALLTENREVFENTYMFDRETQTWVPDIKYYTKERWVRHELLRGMEDTTWKDLVKWVKENVMLVEWVKFNAELFQRLRKNQLEKTIPGVL